MLKKLSIITINWNNADGLQKTIESVISQMSDECEYIVIDGNSWDTSGNVVLQYQQFITEFISEPNAGIYGNMNRGIAIAKGEYCLFLNSGDLLVEGVLQAALSKCLGEDIIYFDTYLSYNNRQIEELSYPEQLTMRSFYERTIGHQSTFIKRALFEKYGYYNETNKIHSDYEFWINSIIVNNCTHKHVNFPLAYYDMGGRSSKPDANTTSEVQAILSRYIPERILEDYQYWHQKEKEIEILMWYKRQDILYNMLVFLYKVLKNFRKYLKMNY